MFSLFLRRLSLIMAGLGGIAMLLLLGLVCANIILRPFGHSVRGTLEMSGYLCALAVGLCLPAAQLAGSHIGAGLWAGSMPHAFQRVAGPLCNALCAWALLLVGRELWNTAQYARMMNEYIDGFPFSYAAMATGFAAGAALHALLFLHTALTEFMALPGRGSRNMVKGEQA